MPDDITGRDGYIIGRALATALVALEQLPAKRQPKSDMEDMRKLLSAGIDQSFTIFAALGTSPMRSFPRPRSNLDLSGIWADERSRRVSQ